MQVMLDMLGSIIIFGWILMMVLRGQLDSNETMQLLQGDALVQGNLVELTRVLEYDMRKIGFCNEPNNLPDPTKAIILADTSSIKFLTDVDFGSGPDGVVDTVYYYLGSTSELASTPNPRDRVLYRVVDSETPKGTDLGVTYFNLKYYTSQGVQITTPVSAANLSAIATIQISMKVEAVYASTLADKSHIVSADTNYITNQYASAYWQQIRLSSRNYRNR